MGKFGFAAGLGLAFMVGLLASQGIEAANASAAHAEAAALEKRLAALESVLTIDPQTGDVALAASGALSLSGASGVSIMSAAETNVEGAVLRLNNGRRPLATLGDRVTTTVLPPNGVGGGGGGHDHVIIGPGSPTVLVP
ncbi:MAG: hypothetical protein AAGC95_03340 [Pseudomonadota bacterium]